MTCSATLRHNAAEAAIVGARDERVWARDGGHASAVRLERCRDRLRGKLRLCDPQVAGLFRADRPAEIWVLAPFAPEIARGSSRRVSSPLVEAPAERSRRPWRQRARRCYAVSARRRPPPATQSGESLAAWFRRAAQVVDRRLRPPPRASGSASAAPDIPPPVVYDPNRRRPRFRRCKARSRRRWDASSRVTIAAILSAQATGAPRAERLQLSTPGALTRRCGSAKAA